MLLRVSCITCCIISMFIVTLSSYMIPNLLFLYAMVEGKYDSMCHVHLLIILIAVLVCLLNCHHFIKLIIQCPLILMRCRVFSKYRSATPISYISNVQCDSLALGIMYSVRAGAYNARNQIVLNKTSGLIS